MLGLARGGAEWCATRGVASAVNNGVLAVVNGAYGRVS